ncbi:MAG: division/cell wall cluster transcriptional repressor MraZ [Chthoniobacterales bacterium]
MSSLNSHSIVYAGTFERVMDAKNRVTIPAAWLGKGTNDFHAIPNPTGECLIVMPSGEFNQMEERINQSTASPASKRKAIRQFYSQARAVSADAQGRILFADEQCCPLNLSGNIVLVGSRSRFEIWNSKCWGVVAKEEHACFCEVAELIGL